MKRHLVFLIKINNHQVLIIKRIEVAFYFYFYFYFFLRFYLFIHERHRERGRDTGRGRSMLYAGSLMWDSILGFQDHAPKPKADAQRLSHPGVPGSDNFNKAA